MKRPFTAIVIGILILVVVLVALSTGASLFLSETPVVSSDKVALIKIDGLILDSQDVIDQLKKYSKNSSVKAIVLRIDSPGGAVVPSQEIYEEIKKVRAKNRKVITSMGTVAASGGYYIASASDKIMANPGTLTGSIGVIMEFASFEQLLNKIGVKGEVVKSGAMKDVGDPMRTMTADEKAYLQKVINDVFDQFVSAVAAGRHMDKAKVLSLADGSVYTGRQAKELGLVDELGDQEDAIRLAARMCNIQGEPKVITEEKKTSLLDLIRGKEDVGNLFRGMVPRNLESLMYVFSPQVK